MKLIKKLSALLLAVIILTISLPATSVFAADSDMRYGRTKLNADQQYVYDKLVTGCESATADIKIDISNKNIDFDNDLSFIFYMFYSDYPEYFWITGGYEAGFEQIGSTVTLTIKPEYYMTGSALTSAKSAYNSKVNELTSGLSGKSDYEKAKILHDRLIDTVTYKSIKDKDQSSYDAIVSGEAVCNGYAKAYQHLMLKAGIPTWFVKGTSINPDTNSPEGHAWNLVKLDGAWYYTDVTWDDQINDIFYEYLNVPSKQFLSDHTLDDIYKDLVPSTGSSSSVYYYKKENRVFTGYDQNRLVELLKKDGNKTQIYIDGDVNSFITAIDNNLLSIGDQLSGKGTYSEISRSVKRLKNAVRITLVLVPKNHTHAVKTTVKQKDATCFSNGTKAYYICSCGVEFLDSACKTEITNNNQLTIPATSHTPSGWKNNASNHWKECTKCGNETANTRGSHVDKNKDYKCDTCAYSLPAPDKNNSVPSGGSTNSSSGTTSNSSKPDKKPVTSKPSSNDNTSSNVVTSKPTSSNNTSSSTVTSTPETNESVDISSTESSATTDKNNSINEVIANNGSEENTTEEKNTEDKKENKKSFDIKKIIIWGGCALVIVAAIAVVTVVLIKKRKNS